MHPLTIEGERLAVIGMVWKAWSFILAALTHYRIHTLDAKRGLLTPLEADQGLGGGGILASGTANSRRL